MADTNKALISMLTEQKELLEKQLKDSKSEEIRLRYMATGYAGLIAMSANAEMIAKAAQIALEADKL